MGLDFKSKCNAVGSCLVLLGVVTVLSMGVMLPAYVNTFHYNTALVEHMVVDERDSLSDKRTWRSFVWGSKNNLRDSAEQPLDRTRAAKLHMFYVFVVGNGELVMKHRDALQKNPFVSQEGPFGYREYVEKYDVRFTNRGPDNTGSDLVTWKQWSYYQPLMQGDEACRTMDGRLEQKGALSVCMDDAFVYTLVNRQFLQYIQEHTTAGVVGKVGHKLFGEVRQIFTKYNGPFMTNVKMWHVSSEIEKVAKIQGMFKISEAIQDVLIYRDAYKTLLPKARLLPEYQTFPSTYVPVLSAHNPAIPKQMSVTAWVKQEFDNSGFIFAKVVSAADARCCWCFSMNGYAADDDFKFEFGKGAADAGSQMLYSRKWDQYDKDGLWHHIALVIAEEVSQMTATFYVDGQRFGASNLFAKDALGDCAGGVTYIGSRGPGGNLPTERRFKGQLSDVRYFDRVLMDEEVNSIFRSPSSYDALGKTGRLFCGEAQNSDKRKDCPFGAANFILAEAQKMKPTAVDGWIENEKALNTGQTQYLLNASAQVGTYAAGHAGFMGGLSTSFLFWINASEYFRGETHGPEKNAQNLQAYNSLIDVMQAWEVAGNGAAAGAYNISKYGGYNAAANGGVSLVRRIATAKVNGVLMYLFDAAGWINEKATKQKVARDWIGKPLNSISCEKHSFVPCQWEIEPFRYFMGVKKVPSFAYTGADNPNVPTDVQLSLDLSVNQARRLIDPAFKHADLGLGRGITMSLLNSDSLPRVWGLASHYCNAWRNSKDMSCDGMKKAIEMAKDILPRALSKLDNMHSSIYSNNIWPKFKYEQLVCVIADYVADNWLKNNTWYEDKLAASINLAFPEVWNASGPNLPLTRARLGEIGYMQWGTGHYTRKRFGVNSIADIPDSGNSEGLAFNYPVSHTRIEWLSMSNLEMDREPLELGSVASAGGFPTAANAANLPLASATLLLDELANITAYTMTHPVHTLCARLVRGATKLMIGHPVNLTNMPVPDTYVRGTNVWSNSSLATVGAWGARALSKSYSITYKLNNASLGITKGFATIMEAVGASNRNFPIFSLDSENVSTTWAPWTDTDGMNYDDSYEFPTYELRDILSPASATPVAPLRSAEMAAAALKRTAAASAVTQFMTKNGAGTGAKIVATDMLFLTGIMLSVPGCAPDGGPPAEGVEGKFSPSLCAPFQAGAKATTQQAATAGCCLWSSASLNANRLLPQNGASELAACVDVWAFRNALLLNASCQPAEHGVHVSYSDPSVADGNVTEVSKAEWNAAKGAFFEAAIAVDLANIATRGASFKSTSYNVQSSSALASPLGTLAGFDSAKYGALLTLPLPFPILVRPVKKRATILAGMIQSYAINGFFLKRQAFCSAGPKVCDYRKGGMFTTQRVRDYLFEGYTDPLFSILAQDNFERHGYRYSCLSERQLETTWNCGQVYDIDCSRGFSISVADVQTVTTRSDNYQYVNNGEFRLAYGGHNTSIINFDASPETMKAALEGLPGVGEVKVTRSPMTPKGRDALSYSLAKTRHGDYGFTWTVTFLTEKGNQPLLAVPYSNFSSSVGTSAWTGDGDQVWIRKVHNGVHPGANFSPLMRYSHDTARYNGEWFRRALTVPDVRNATTWGGCTTSNCRAPEDARPMIKLGNPAFVARDMWFGDLWHGKLWRNSRFHKEQECSRTDDSLRTIFYDYNKRYER